MIKHIVMWCLKEKAGGAAKEENARAMKARLESLPEVIPEIRRLEVGLNVKDSERAADVVLYSELAALRPWPRTAATPRTRKW